jgi:hypothetical protein
MKIITNIFNKKGDYSGTVSSPEERVDAFISHWHEQWSTALRKMGKDVDFDYWGTLISQVDDTHFIEGSSSGSRNSFGSRADYDPEFEKISECDIRSNTAQVYTEKYDAALKSSTYHVYDLKRDTDGNWLIWRIFTLCHPPKSPVIDSDKHAEVISLCTANASLVKGEDGLNLNENILFQNNRNISLPHLDEGTPKLDEIGKLQVSSGILGILDFGYDIYDFEPLHKKVNPGEYPVETVTIHDRVAGIRVRFSKDKAPVKWYAANTANGNGVYGVDAGNLAIFDVEKLLNLSRIEKERLFGEWCLSGQPQLLSLTDQNDCVITSSGFGDGAYPAFWGVDEKDQIVSLYIDFMILVKETEEGTYVSA